MHGSVGQGRANRTDDVSRVQLLLLRHQRWLDGAVPHVTGRFDPVTGQAIRAFQKNAGAVLRPDGVVSANGFTWPGIDRPAAASGVRAAVLVSPP